MTQYNFDQFINRTNTACFKWDLCDERFGGKDLLPFWVADMDFEAPPPVLEALKKRTDHGVYGYTFQTPSLTDSILAWNKKRHQWECSKESVLYTSGVVPSLILAIHAFSSPGDKVIIQSPVYYPFFQIVPKNERELILNPLKNNGGKYEMDFDQLRSVIKGAKLFILCSPHNPVGRVWTKAELLKLGEICLEHNVLIVSDEIHCDIVYPGYKHLPIASLSPELAQNSITCMAPSKTFNIAGLMLSFVIIENPLLREQFEKKREALGHLMNNPFAVLASEVAYREGEEWLNQLLVYLKGNFDLIQDEMRNHFLQVQSTNLEGTFLAWLNMKNLGLSDEELSQRLLEKAHLALSDGKAFGKEGTLFRRVNFACPRALLKEGLERLRLIKS